MIGRLKSFTRMVFRRTQYRVLSLLGSTVDWAGAVGDGTGSSTVTAPLFWVARTFPEAPPGLWRQLDNGQEELVRDHEMLRLLRRPNQHYTGVTMWMATVIDYQVDGNAYWLKIRDRGGRVRELWWVPHWMIEPRGDETEFVTHYEYRPGAEPLRVNVDDVVHFRFGLDGDDPRKGKAPLKSVLREVYTDDEAASFTASLLKNMGVPGLVVSPKTGVSINEAQAADVKANVEAKFTGEGRGSTVVMTGATDIAQFGFSPEQLLLRELRRVPEERVTAVMGIPAIVAGLGAGLDRSTFTNMGEAREAAYEAGIIPMQRILAEEVLFQLLVDFEEDVFVWRFGFDLSKVRVLQEDLYRQAQRHDLLIRGGWEQVAEGRRAMGLDVNDDRDRIFLRPLNVEAVPASGPAAPRQNGNGNGNGASHYSPDEIAGAVMQALERRELTTA